MIVKVYAYRDIQIGAFNKPFYDTNEPEVVKTQVARTVSLSSVEDIEKAHLRDLELYYLGTFDDESGLIHSDVRFLIRLDKYCRKEKVEDEQSVQSGSKEEN